MNRFVLIIALLGWTLPAERSFSLEIGASEETVVKQLGQPGGRVKAGATLYLSYPAGIISLEDGIVTAIPDNFERKKALQTATKIKKEGFAKSQREKGFVEHGGTWMSKDDRRIMQLQEADVEEKQKQKALSKQLAEERSERLAKKNAIAPTQADRLRKRAKVYTATGKLVDHSPLLVEDKITIIEFYTSNNRASRVLGPELERFARADAGVVHRRIDMTDEHSVVSKQYGVHSAPDIRIFDRLGRMVAPACYTLQTSIRYVDLAR